MIKIFISYSHSDRSFLEDLQKQLAQLSRNREIEIWTDKNIAPGGPWNEEIHKHLQSTDVILLLVSSDYLHSNYSYEVEVTAAMNRHAEGKATVIPIILRPCDWVNTPFAKLQALPSNAVAVSVWPNKDEAYLNIVDGIKRKIARRETELMGRILEPQPLSFKEQLAEIRRKFLLATDTRTLKKLLFEINQLEKENHTDFELDELKDKIRDSIQYNSSPPASKAPAPVSHRPMFTRFISVAWQTHQTSTILIAIGLVGLIMYLSYLYWFA
jgi:TIR domain